MRCNYRFGIALALGCALLTTTSLAQSNDPEQAKQEIDELGKQVFKPRNARKANQDLAAYCAKIQARLRGLERATWEPVARYCFDAKKKMEEYNPGSLPRQFVPDSEPPPTAKPKKPAQSTTEKRTKVQKPPSQLPQRGGPGGGGD